MSDVRMWNDGSQIASLIRYHIPIIIMPSLRLRVYISFWHLEDIYYAQSKVYGYKLVNVVERSKTLI